MCLLVGGLIVDNKCNLDGVVALFIGFFVKQSMVSYLLRLRQSNLATCLVFTSRWPWLPCQHWSPLPLCIFPFWFCQAHWSSFLVQRACLRTLTKAEKLDPNPTPSTVTDFIDSNDNVVNPFPLLISHLGLLSCLDVDWKCNVRFLHAQVQFIYLKSGDQLSNKLAVSNRIQPAPA